MSKIIGIDLGTTNSVVCVMEGNEPKVIMPSEIKLPAKDRTVHGILQESRISKDGGAEEE